MLDWAEKIANRKKVDSSVYKSLLRSPLELTEENIQKNLKNKMCCCKTHLLHEESEKFELISSEPDK